MGRLCVLALGATAAVGCVKNPATGERQLTLVPKSQEISMGKQAAEEVASSMGMVDNPALSAYVAGIGQRLAAVSERPNLPWSFQVVDDASVNAFALPGGPIFVTRGILAHLDNEAQLAAVLGHEIGHVTGKHAVNRLSKAQIAQVGLGLGMIFSDTFRQFGQLGSAGMQLAFLKFSRDDERESDDLGLRYAYKAGYDVREMPDVFATLKRVSEKGGARGRAPEWMATHPNPENRVTRTQERLASLEKKGSVNSRMMIDREEYLQMLNGVAYGDNPRQGFFQGDRFMHPEMRFTLDLPSGWKKANTPQAVIAMSPGQDAAVQLTLTKASSPEQALQAFASQKGLQMGRGTRNTVPGFPSASAEFAAQTEKGTLAGIITFVSDGGKTYQIVTFTEAGRAGGYAQAFQRVHGSFARLTDPAALAVQPARIAIEKAPRAMTLAELYRERPATASIEDIALLNQTEPGAALQAGQLVKWVRGGTAAPGATGAPPSSPAAAGAPPSSPAAGAAVAPAPTSAPPVTGAPPPAVPQ